MKLIKWSLDDIAAIMWCVRGERSMIGLYRKRGEAQLRRIAEQLENLFNTHDVRMKRGEKHPGFELRPLPGIPKSCYSSAGRKPRTLKDS